jgi:hypothetical protein
MIDDDVIHKISIHPATIDGKITVVCKCGWNDGTYVSRDIAEASGFRHMASYGGNPLRKEVK